jgi:hypothetical protein
VSEGTFLTPPSGAPLEVRPFSASAEIDKLAAALAEAHKLLPAIEKSKTAKVPTKSGGEYSYDYADLALILKVTRPVLAAQGLVVLQPPAVAQGAAVEIQTIILHTSGQWVASSLVVPVTDTRDAQKLGSAISYGRRYAYCGMVGIAAEDEDDDGAQARSRPAQGAVRRRDDRATMRERPAPAAREEKESAKPISPEALITSVNGDGSPGGQKGRLTQILREHKVNATEFKGYLKETYGYDGLAEIKQKHYEDIVALAQSWPGVAAAAPASA